jgi:uncharacterized RDD family membrane protein YckC
MDVRRSGLVTEDSFQIICDGCRSPVAADAEVCPSCGTVLIETPTQRRKPTPAPVPTHSVAPLHTTARTRVAPQSGHPLSDEPPAPVKPMTAEAIVAAATAAEKPRYVPGAGEYPKSSYGGFWIRAVAFLIDNALLFALLVVLHRAVGEPAAAIVVAVVGFFYFPLMEGSKSQGTLGKGMCALAVTDTSGRRISYTRAFGRYFARILDFGVGYLLAGVTPRKRALHDYIAGTLVLRRGMY